MYIVLLRFTEHRQRAGEFMQGHKEWLEQGFARHIFLLAGSLDSQAGGAIIAAGIPREALDQVIGSDPFVIHGVVQPEVLALKPSRLHENLNALLSQD
ncbi:hypothetical protein RB25_14720 [Herbaspirillum rubrisubalbicans]|uniref:YCII-related domain-containing protein n=1 Tax=Herbaspirillum rubrisubalbicans TaxID=80842 RepID=A0ABX9BY79_9BURK|nr:hypothetical protein [Herbaspirillum rubrisubalbicans]MCP1575399.1 uncharacterized protein YciI [Herbaspirillum rubrisubalbicans]RAM62943.1 hypothetical protein RB24_18445 [Herbaspirillum rubrisubalbicans]RAN46711.1 hypothetical protein RB25_14720 [Herbaspirillum rubrisubalbicans]